jgi:hypothetical protein
MKIEIKKFGDILTSRPAGREALLVVKAYFDLGPSGEPIELEFAGVKVMTPSWLDEFITGLKKEFGTRVCCLPSDNPTVIESLKVLQNLT